MRIPGVPSYRGALSYAVARALEGAADENHDGKVTLKELFGYVRQVVYQLSDQRQNPVTLNSPHRNIEREVAFEMTRAVKVVDAAAAETRSPQRRPAWRCRRPRRRRRLRRCASPRSTVRRRAFRGLDPREAAFDVVPPSQAPDLVWDPATGDVLAGADVIAYRMQKAELPSAIDRVAAARAAQAGRREGAAGDPGDPGRRACIAPTARWRWRSAI